MDFKTINISTISPKNTLWLILLLGLILRLAIAIYSYENQVWLKYSDDLARINFANSIIQKGFVPDIKNFFTIECITAPFISTWLALNISVFGHTWLPVFLFNALLGTLSCFIVFKIANSYFSEKVSLFATLWAACYPNYLRYIGTSGNEIWIVFWVALLILMLIRSINDEKSTLSVVVMGIVYTLLFHTDERYFSYFPLLIVLLLLNQFAFTQKIKKIALFIVIVVMLSTPWMIRNYLLYDEVVVVSLRTISLTSKFIDHSDRLMVFDHEPDKRVLSEKEIRLIQSGELKQFKDGTSISELQIKAMKDGNIPHQFNTLEKILSRAYFLWVPFKFHDNWRIDGFAFNPAWSLGHNLVSILSYALLLPFVLFSFILLWKNKNYLGWIIFTSVIIYHTFIHVAFIPYTRDRYRHPIDFIIIILGCYGIDQSVKYLLKLISNEPWRGIGIQK